MKRVASISAKKSGFTLLELLIVMAILIVVIGMLGTTVWGQYRKALIRTATVQVTSKLTDALELFFLDFKRYPTQAEALFILADLDNPDAQNVQQNMQMQQAAVQGANNMQQNQGMGGMQTGMDGMGGMGGMQTGMTGMDAMGGMQTGMTGMDGMGGMQTGMTGMDGMGGMQTGMTGMDGMGGMQAGMTGMDSMGGMNSGANMNGAQQNNMVYAGNPISQQVYKRPKIVEPYVKEQDLKDPWNQTYCYEWPTTKGDGKKPAIWSCGPDKENNNGEGDDIINWDPNDTSGQMRAQQQANNMNQGMNGMNQGMTGMDGMNGMNQGMTGMDGMNGMNQGMTGMDGMNGMNQGMTGMDGMGGMGGMNQGMTGMDGMGGMQPNMDGMQPNMGGMNGMQPGMTGMDQGMNGMGGTNMNGGMNPGMTGGAFGM